MSKKTYNRQKQYKFEDIKFYPNEEWKFVDYPKIFKERYIISNYGRIYSIPSQRLLRPTDHQQGYFHVTLGSNKGPKKVLLHRLVAWHFVPGHTKEKDFVDHKDGNKKNTYYKNLEWVTQGENTKRAYELGLNRGYDKSGSNNPNYKYTPEMINLLVELRYNQKLPIKEIVNIVLEKYPEKGFTKKSVYKYIQTKLKYRLEKDRQRMSSTTIETKICNSEMIA